MRGRLAHCLAQDKDGVHRLVDLLGREDIGEEVYLALHSASQRAGVRVLAGAEGSHEILPLVR